MFLLIDTPPLAMPVFTGPRYTIRKDDLGWILLDTRAAPGTGRTSIHDSHDDAVAEFERRQLVTLAGDEFAVTYPAGLTHPVYLRRTDGGQTTRWHNAGQAIAFILALRAAAAHRAALALKRDQAFILADVALDTAAHAAVALAKAGA